jgi:hypothetical protein
MAQPNEFISRARSEKCLRVKHRRRSEEPRRYRVGQLVADALDAHSRDSAVRLR